MAVFTVAVAGEAAFWLKSGPATPTATAGILFAGNVVPLFLMTGLLGPAESRS